MRRPSASILAAVGIATVVGLLVGIGYLTAFNGFTRLEHDLALQHAWRVNNSLRSELDSMARIAAEWTPRADPAAYLHGESPDFLAANAGPETLRNLDIDIMVLALPDGSVVGAASADGPDEGGSRIPEALSGALAPALPLTTFTNSTQTRRGYVRSGNHVLMVATQQVTDSASDDPVAGVLLMGRYLNQAELDRLSAGSDVDVYLERPTAPTAAGDTAVEVLDDSTLRTRTLMRDVYGNPLGNLATRHSRDITTIGTGAFGAYTVSLLALGAVSIAVATHLIALNERTVRQRESAQVALESSEHRYRSLVDRLADAVFGFDAKGSILYANQEAERLTGHSRDRLLDMTMADLVAPDSALLLERLAQHTGAPDSAEITLITASGGRAPVEVVTGALDASIAGERAVQWIARDITERKRFEDELSHLATHDHLTGLYNRRRFEHELEDRLGRALRDGEHGATLWLDLDYFKEVNDVLGHVAGDDLLIKVADVLASSVRSGSVVARLGGDEFAILLPGVTACEADRTARRIVDVLSTTRMVVAGRDIAVTASVGVVMYPDDGTTPVDLLAKADLAMYRAKEEGRNRVCMFESAETWHTELTDRFDWVLEIMNALKEDRLAVHAQPIVDVKTGTIDRYELLVRMIAPNGDLVMPGVFLPIAERAGLIVELDRWMVRHVISLLMMSDPAIRMDVNLSGHAFADRDLLPLIADELHASGVDPGRLGIEITETAAVIDMAKARTFVEAVKALGCRVALDDFGSGFSSFYYLRNLPIDTLKIDGSYVQHIVDTPADQHVVRAIVELSKGFGIETTAEFVESADQLVLLDELGVNYAQGYHIAKPEPLHIAFAKTVA